MSASPARRTWWRWLAYVARRGLLLELGSYLAIYRFVCRRPRVPAGATGFSHHQPVLAILLAFIVLSSVELVVVDLLVRRWEPVRIPLLVVGIWGVVWMLGLLCALLTRPHAVGPDGLRVRSGSEIDIPLRWDVVSWVRRRKHTVQGRQPQVMLDDRGNAALYLRVQHETNIEIALTEPVRVRLPQGGETVTRIALYADDPQALLDAVARHRPAARTPGGGHGRLP